jgi:nicotinamidase/pyrazinamidase
MTAREIIFWEVDTQADFMLPGGKLYVPGAEKIIPNIERLLQAARVSHTLVVSSRCAHTENDPEFERFPPHCIRGTPGAEIIPEGIMQDHRIVSNEPAMTLPSDILRAPQIVIEKQMLDVFSNPHTNGLVEQLGGDAKYVVFGVATEYCVQLAARGLLERGRKVTIVTDALETLNAEVGRRTVGELRSMGAKTTTTSQIVAEVNGRVEKTGAGGRR